MRLVDWYLGLSLGQKVVVGVAVLALVFVGSYLASLLILSVAVVGGADYPSQGGTPAPASHGPGASASASSAPTIALKIERARLSSASFLRTVRVHRRGQIARRQNPTQTSLPVPTSSRCRPPTLLEMPTQPLRAVPGLSRARAPIPQRPLS